jgi:hypothetical protein
MKTTEAGLADILEAAERLQLRGPALEAMVAMFGFALPSSSDTVPLRTPSQPPPDEADDDAGGIGTITAATEALSPSVRRLEPVRQGPTPASRWTDPLSETRETRSLAAQRERAMRATCRIRGLKATSYGYLVSGNRIMTSVDAVTGNALRGRIIVTFPGQTSSRATPRRAPGGSTDAAVLEWHEPAGTIAPVTFGRVVQGPCEAYVRPGMDRSLRIAGELVHRAGRSGLSSLMLESKGLIGSGAMVGLPILQHGRVVGHVKAGSDRERAAFGPNAVFVSRAEDFLATTLPDEILHAPIVEAPAPQPLAFEGLFAPRDAVALLRLAASMPTPGEGIDVASVTGDLARAKPLLTLPRLRVPSLAFGALLLVDVGQPMQPFWEDQQEFVDRFRRALRGLAEVRFVGDDPHAGAGRERRKGSWTPFELPRPGTPVIALSDIGCGFPPRPETVRAWLELAGQLRRRQCRVVAFAPVRPGRVAPALRRAIAVAIWDRAARRRNLSRLTRLTDG